MYKSPTDPVEKRAGFYVMKETQIEGMDKEGEYYLQQIYLDNGRILHCLQCVGGIEDSTIIAMMETCQGFRKLVHSIGVSVSMETGSYSEVEFRLKCYGTQDIFGGGTVVRKVLSADDSEHIINLDEVVWSEQDDVLGSIQFCFKEQGQLASATVRFYLHDGYVVEEHLEEETLDIQSEQYKEMIKQSFISSGNTLRLKKALEKAKNGEDMTIAFIGGSITQGAGAKPIYSNCYANLTYQGIKDKFARGKSSVHMVKAGVGGTPSELGLLRYDREVLKGGSVHPDIVIVEFGVNDTEDELEGGCYESLVRKIYNGHDKPAVVLLFSVFEDGFNLQERLIPIGEHYKLPMVSVKNAVVPQFGNKQNRVLSKRQYFYDIYHPTNTGHRVMADCLLYLFEYVDGCTAVEETVLMDDFVYSKELEHIKFFDRKYIPFGVTVDVGDFTEKDTELQMVERDENSFQTPEFPNNWKCKKNGRENPFILNITSKNLLLVFKDSGDEKVGSAEVWIDGKFVKELDPHFNNWTHCNTKILYCNESVAHHQVVIKMKEEDKDKQFTILGFGYTD